MSPEERELAEHMFNELEMPKREMSSSTLSFIADLKDKFDRTGYLTDGQYEKLKEVYQEKCE